MNFDFIRRFFCLNINYRTVNNEFARLCSLVRYCFFTIVLIVGHKTNYFANQIYKIFTFVISRVRRVINKEFEYFDVSFVIPTQNAIFVNSYIHRLVNCFATFNSKKRRFIESPFSFVDNSKNIFVWQ